MQNVIIHWLQENAIPLKGVEAEQGFEDMQPLKQVIGDARIVALGEATHGTREFFQLKHRMLEFLVREMGFTVFGIEATMPEAFDINEYLLTGKGDPEKALAGLYFWTWHTEEVLEMIRWMRRYNADPSHPNKVKFYGFDMQYGVRALKVLDAYLAQLDVNGKDITPFKDNGIFDLLQNPYTVSTYEELSEKDKRMTLATVTSVIEDLEANKVAYIKQTSENAWQIARIHATVLSQYLESQMPFDDFAPTMLIRETSMAANIDWIMKHEGPAAKMVVWAHNYHVSTQENEAYGSMGHYLREIYGDEMVIFGFTFQQGSFQAISNSGGRSLRPFHVKPLPEESLDTTLGATGLSYAAIDLRQLPREGDVAEWFKKPYKRRSLGSMFNPQADPQASIYSTYTENVAERYDVLFFIDETTAARPNPGGMRPPQRVLKIPENLDFEEGEVGWFPPGWHGHKYRLADFDFHAETSSESPHQGEKCVQFSRRHGKHYGETFASLSQRIDAMSYHGQTIRLRAAARAEVEGFENAAYIWLRITGEGFGPQAELFHDGMAERPITASEWQDYEISAEVSKDAKWIELGMAFTGEGTVWFDSFSLESIEHS